MAVQDIFKSNVAVALALGLAAAVVVPMMLPVIARASKPFAKAVIKSGLIVYEKGREAFAEVSEVVEDVVAEAQAEIEQEHAAKAVAATVEVAAKPASET
jgi:hypothetical protein